MHGSAVERTPPDQRRITPKSAFWAAFLQCIPLLGAGACVANGASDQGAQGWALLLWFSVLFWGIGYFYVGALPRAAAAVLLGPVLAIGACTASFSGVTYDYEHGETDPAQVSSANRASAQTGLIVSLVVMMMAVDAARLAAARTRDAASAPG